MLISNVAIVFFELLSKYLNQTFAVPNLLLLLLLLLFLLFLFYMDRLEGADFKYDNSFVLKFQAFLFCKKDSIFANLMLFISNVALLFHSLSLNIPKQSIFNILFCNMKLQMNLIVLT